MRVKHLAGAAVLLAGCSSPEERDQLVGSAQHSALLDGSAASDPAVVALVVRRTRCDAPAPAIVCTGVLVAPRLVLTAAHCVDRSPRGEREVLFGSAASAQPTYRGISAVALHPTYDRNRDDDDVALVWLSEEAPVAPLALLDQPLDESWLGRSARVVGFGLTAVTQGQAVSGEKLEGTVSISALDANTLSYTPSPAMTCKGDSGGPVFVNVNGSETMIAITTSGDRRCERVGVGLRLDRKLAQFIEPVIAAGPPAAPGIEQNAVCSAECESDSDCPADLACRGNVNGENRCQLSGVDDGAFTETCAHDAECGGGACIPLGAECRCQVPCARSVESGGAGNGCGLGAARATPSWWPLGFIALLTWAKHLRGKIRAAGRHDGRH